MPSGAKLDGHFLTRSIMLSNADPYSTNLAPDKLRLAVTERRVRYVKAGYEPLPCTGKRPAPLAWSSISVDLDTIGTLSDGYPDALNTGIRTKYTPAIDIDIADARVADLVQAVALKTIPNDGTILKRVGRAPRRLIPFRCSMPFDKMQALFVDPDNRLLDKDGKETLHKVEFLGDGQQFIAEGVHPDTGRPYQWEDLCLIDVERKLLPLIDEAAARLVMTEVTRAIEAEGWIEVNSRGRPKTAPAAPTAPATVKTVRAPASSNGRGPVRYGRNAAWAAAALRGCARDLADTKSGDRNATLNAAAYRMATMAARGWVDRGEVRAALMAAADQCGLVADDGRAAAEATFESGFNAGLEVPHEDLRDRPGAGNGLGDNELGPAQQGVRHEAIELDDFRAYMPTHSYLFIPTRQMWAASSVNARIAPQVVAGPDGGPLLDNSGEPKTVSASAWLDRNRPVEQMTWAPGAPMIIEDRLISEGGWIEHNGIKCFNLYRAPIISLGNAGMATPWVDHMRRVFDSDVEHLLDWLAHRVQRPDDKINHAIVLGGPQGIGKDTALEPVKRAVGPWNFCEVSPHHMLGRFNGFLKSVILRVSEARDLGDVNRFQFYDHMKAYTAAPPDVLRVDEKHLPEYAVPNCCGVIITTNHKADGIFLPPDDRRHYVAWSNLIKDDLNNDYWNTLWRWYDDGGDSHVAAYLTERDISKFNPKAPPPKTPAFWDIVDASRAPEDAELADVLDVLGNPYTITLAEIRATATGSFLEWLLDR
jgi:hypothetical protein